jgi:ABC-type multidrug transport system fused ATPase/permease subunit
VMTGTVRENLDPSATYSEDAIATALRQAGLEKWVQGLQVQFLVGSLHGVTTRGGFI